jgi:hypothetical protein
VQVPRITALRWGLAPALGAALGLASLAGAERIEGPESFYHPFPVESLGSVEPAVPARIEILPPRGIESWPEPLREEVGARVRREWDAGRAYGLIRDGVRMFLTYPLVTAWYEDRAVVPVVQTEQLPISGVLELPEGRGARSVVVLIDASSSANASVRFRGPEGSPSRLSVLDAERRAVDRLLDVIDPERVELGLIAFGETTQPIAEPGASIEQIRRRLEAHRREQPRGAGRTDLVCALWLAREWLDDASAGRSREIVLLTDGDLPHSGRFTDCGRATLRSSSARAACEARLNRTTCPASQRFRRADGSSDIVQLTAFARRSRRRVRVHPLVFEPDRPARVHRELALRTGGKLARVPSAEAVEAVLPMIVARRIRGVYARNTRTGDETANLYDPAKTRFDGTLPLAPGANDVELRVVGARGIAGLVRLRIYSEAELLEGFASQVRARNRALERQLGSLRRAGQTAEGTDGARSLELAPEGAPAPASPARD